MTTSLLPSLQDRRRAAVPRGIATATPLFAERALNSEIWDSEGRRYIDFAAGIAVLNVGHRHPRVIAAASAQLERITHASFQVMGYRPYVELAEALNAIAPFSGGASTLLLNTGAEAVENAVKIARKATGRAAVIAFGGAFHGRTLMATALTGKVANYKRGYGAMMADVYHVPFPMPGSGVDVVDSLRALDFLLAVDVDPDRVAAIIVEPVQGEGGFNPAPVELLQGLRTLCDRYGILLIVDEVQSGFARTGRMFAIQHSGVEPDLVAVAKGMGGGFPIAGVIGRASIMNAGDPGSLGSTYGGSPVACAAGLAVLDIIRDEHLEARAVAIGARLSARIGEFGSRNDLLPISAPRGMGAMVAFDILSPTCGEPEPGGAKGVVTRAMELGLILLTCGAFGQAVRILTPLTISDELLDEGLAVLETALKTADLNQLQEDGGA